MLHACLALCLALGAPLANTVGGSDRTPLEQTVSDFTLAKNDSRHLAMRADSALSAMVSEGTAALEHQGFWNTAEAYRKEYRERWAHEIQRLVEMEGIGDHRPLSDWLVKFYADLVGLLGQSLVDQLHLNDIPVFNYGFPITLGMKEFLGETIEFDEYVAHFIPFSGAVAYWASFIACEIGLAAANVPYLPICMPIGQAARFAMITWIAPRLADDAYEYFWQDGRHH